MELSKEAFLEGQVLLVDKPYGWSSFQAVNAIRWTIRKAFDLRKIKVGHAGTLDPLATGLLLICTGKKTKTIAALQGQPKEYTGTLVLGATTPSYDLETEPEPFGPWDHLESAYLEATTENYLGTIQQRPPVFSAVKKDGKRLYELARKGENPDIPARSVHVTAFDLTRIALPEIDFRVACGKGTYIRSLVHDFGQDLGSGAYLSALKRTKIGDYHVYNAQTPNEIKGIFREAGYPIPPDKAPGQLPQEIK